MRIEYHADTDSLRITLKPETEDVAGEELAEGVVVHRDDAGELYTVEVQSRASERADLDALEVIGLPLR